jgi:hypothetical protein
MAAVILCLPPAARAAGNSSANIDQARNGTASAPISPVHFQNGNAGAQNSHYLEGHSIPYRVRLDGLTPGTHTVVIGWDIRQGGKNALDYITSPNRLEPHSQFLPPHPAEVVDPLEGLSGSFAGPTHFGIPVPVAVLSGQPLASFNALPAAEKELWTYNGTVTGASYVNNADGNLGNLSAAASESRMQITFTANASSVVIAFGGHIASQADWGAGNSASAINGSPYHGRVISLDNTSIGNQDRSLSADAVLGCNLTGPPSACSGTVQTFSETSHESGVNYVWSFTSNSSGASFVGSTTGSSVQVNVGQAVGGSEGFTLQVAISNGKSAVTCSLPFTVNPAPIVELTGESLVCPDGVRTYSGPAGMSTYHWTVTGGTIQGAADGRSVTVRAGHLCNGTLTLTLDVTNTAGCAGRGAMTVNVRDTQAPVISGVGEPSSVECPASPVFSSPSASDDCGGAVTLTFKDAQAPGRCPNESVVTRTWTATDGCGNASTASQSITIVDHTAPVFAALPEPSTIECPATPSFATASATDLCDPNPRLGFVDVTTPGSCAGQSTVTRTWTATDACGNASTASQVIHVVDLTAPVISALPDPSTIECPATPSFASPSATDACDPSPTLESKDVTTPGSCVGQYSVTRTWTAKDACGNTSTASQTINVVDLTAPVIAALPDPSTIECPATPSFATASATDACDPSPRLESKDVTTPGTCAGQYSVTRTWTATDACGNASTASQTIRVVDTTGPVVTCPADITIGVCQNPVPFEIKAEDACGGPVTVVATPPSGSTFAVGDNLVNVVARDACGNESTCSFHVHVLDNPIGEIAGPVAACPGESVTLVGPAGFNYLWGTGATSQSIVVNTAGTYTLTIFDRVTGCPANLSHPFAVLVPPVASITGPDRFCGGTTAQLCGPLGNFDYAWTGPNGFTAATQCIDVTTTATYQLVVKDKLTTCPSDPVSKSVTAAPCFVNCPHTIGWWMAQCGDVLNGSVKYTAGQLAQIYSCVDDQAAIFNWTNDVASFCAVINPTSTDQRTQAKRQFAGFLANVCTSQLGIVATNGDAIVISLDTPISYPGFTSHTIGDLVKEADQRLVALESQQLKKQSVQTQYSQIIDAFDALNNNRIPGSSCPSGAVSVASGGSPMSATFNPNAQSSSAGGDVQDGSSIRLYAPSPNPFTGHTRFAYAVAAGGAEVDVAVFDLAGRRVRQIATGFQPAGRHDAEWDGRSAAGQLVQGGVYYVRARVGGETRVMPLVHMR